MSISLRHERFLFLGYDMRPAPMSHPADWGEQRRQNYLIDPTVVRPCSVDEAVWPTLAPAHDFVGCYQDLWLSLADLLAVSANELANADCSLTLFAVMKESTRRYNEAFSPIFSSGSCHIDPYIIPFSKLDFLGYDIADRWGTSGLANCQFTNDEMDLRIKQQFVTKINRFHLLIDRREAMQCRRLTERRVKEHSPFFVYGIWASGRSCRCRFSYGGSVVVRDTNDCPIHGASA